MPVRFRYSALNNFRVWSNWLRLYIWSVGIAGSSPATLRVSRSKTSTWWNLGNANLLQFGSRIRDVVQLVRMLHLGCSGRAFESRYPDKNIIWPVCCNWLACNTVNIADGVRISNVALLSILLIYKEKIIFQFGFWKRRFLHMTCLLKDYITVYMKINYNWACVWTN